MGDSDNMTLNTLKCWRMTAVVSLSIVLGLMVIQYAADDAAAGIAPLVVYGFIYDSEGLPIEGASVLVEVLRTGATLSDTTDSNGRYDVTFPLDVWLAGDTVETTATYSTLVDSETGVATVTPVLQIDVHFAYAIPEFGSTLGIIVSATLIGLVALISMKRRKAL